MSMRKDTELTPVQKLIIEKIKTNNIILWCTLKTHEKKAVNQLMELNILKKIIQHKIGRVCCTLVDNEQA